jgi:plastocyanin
MKKIIAILLICSAFFAGCKKKDDTQPSGSSSSGSSSPPANEVWIQNMAFNPSSITVTVNTTVKWTNKDGATHTVTSTTGSFPFDSGNLSNGQSFSKQFTTAGTFTYKCTIHSSMTGTVVVQ